MYIGADDSHQAADNIFSEHIPVVRSADQLCSWLQTLLARGDGAGFDPRKLEDILPNTETSSALRIARELLELVSATRPSSPPQGVALKHTREAHGNGHGKENRMGAALARPKHLRGHSGLSRPRPKANSLVSTQMSAPKLSS